MDQTPVSQINSVPQVQPDALRIEKLKKRIRNAGWIATSMGYLYLLLLVVVVVGTFGVAGFFTAVGPPGAGAFLGGALFFVLLFSIAPLLGGVLTAITLIRLGRRITSVEKGKFIWTAGKMNLDADYKRYLFMLTVLSGFIVFINLYEGKIGLNLIIAAIMFIFIFTGYLAAQALYAFPEVTATLEVRNYKRGPGFWWAIIGVAIVLQLIVPAFFVVQELLP